MKKVQHTAVAVLAALLLCLGGCGNQYSAADIQALRDEAYRSGYDAGVISVQDASYAEGKEAGYAEGYEAGYAAGYAEGRDAEAPEEHDAPDQENQDAVAGKDQTNANTSPESEQSAGTQATIHGYSADRTVYVSSSGKKIHLTPDCSGMKNYTSMTLGEAEAHGYAYCSRCF